MNWIDLVYFWKRFASSYFLNQIFAAILYQNAQPKIAKWWGTIFTLMDTNNSAFGCNSDLSGVNVE